MLYISVAAALETRNLNAVKTAGPHDMKPNVDKAIAPADKIRSIVTDKFHELQTKFVVCWLKVKQFEAK